MPIKTLEKSILSSANYILPMVLLTIAHFTSDRILKAGLVTVTGYVIFVVMAFRDGVGWDYSTYYGIVRDGLFEDWELIPKFLASVAYEFQSPELFFALTSAVIIAPFLYISIALGSAIPLLCFLALPVFFFEAMSVIRQGVSMSFAALAYFYFFRGRKYSSTLFSVASACSHLASIPFLIFLLLLNYCSERSIRLAVIFALTAGMLFELILPALAVYLPILNWYRSGATFGWISIAFWMAWLVVFFSTKESRCHYYCFGLGVLLSMILINLDSTLLRAFWYFYIPALFLNYKHALGVVRLPSFFVIPVFWLSFGFTLYVKSIQPLGAALPYKSILFG
jgi:hypothetical protein